MVNIKVILVKGMTLFVLVDVNSSTNRMCECPLPRSPCYVETRRQRSRNRFPLTIGHLYVHYWMHTSYFTLK